MSPEPEEQGPPRLPGFSVTLPQFEGPFDLLLSLIARKRLDVTELALAEVTDDFIAHMRSDWDLGRASEFIVVASTLLALKAHRLLPHDENEEEPDLELLEARDLLFARLLQYKAFKDMSQLMAQTMRTESARQARSVPLEPQFAKLMPELIWRTTPEEFAQIAIRALTPKEAAPTEVGVDHLHGSEVTVREEADQLRLMLADGQEHAFAELIADAETVLVVVVRFLSVLELFRDRAIDVRQDEPLADVWITWTAPEDWSPERLSDEHDVPAPTDPAAEGPAAEDTPHD